MVFYFTATGNSLYAAKQFDTELVSIPQELKKTERHYKADSIGIVCPLYELDMPEVIKEFIKAAVLSADVVEGINCKRNPQDRPDAL